jgi:uncharacterized membrane protein (DUF106 family)
MDLASLLSTLSLSFLREPPASTLFILLLSAGVNLAMGIANRMVIDLAEYRRWMIESSKLRREMMEAVRKGDQRKVARLQRRQQKMMAEQSKMTMERMKLMFLFFLPLIFIWNLLIKFFGRSAVAYMPFDAPWVGSSLNVTLWYILCSLSSNVVISRALGLTFEIEAGDEIAKEG